MRYLSGFPSSYSWILHDQSSVTEKPFFLALQIENFIRKGCLIELAALPYCRLQLNYTLFVVSRLGLCIFLCFYESFHVNLLNLVWIFIPLIEKHKVERGWKGNERSTPGESYNRNSCWKFTMLQEFRI